MANKGTVIVTGGSQGIGAGVVQAFLDRGYAVVATSRNVTKASLPSSPNLALVDGDIGQSSTAEKVVQTAISKFGSIDHVVNNAGIFIAKPFVDYTSQDFEALVSTNIEGFLYVTQLAVKQMLAQGKGGSVTSITTSLLENPNASLPSSLAMITKGGLTAATGQKRVSRHELAAGDVFLIGDHHGSPILYSVLGETMLAACPDRSQNQNHPSPIAAGMVSLGVGEN